MRFNQNYGQATTMPMLIDEQTSFSDMLSPGSHTVNLTVKLHSSKVSNEKKARPFSPSVVDCEPNSSSYKSTAQKVRMFDLPLSAHVIEIPSSGD